MVGSVSGGGTWCVLVVVRGSVLCFGGERGFVVFAGWGGGGVFIVGGMVGGFLVGVGELGVLNWGGGLWFFWLGEGGECVLVGVRRMSVF